MEAYLVHGIFALAVLVLMRWLYKNIVAAGRKKDVPSCGTCPSCASDTASRKVNVTADSGARL